jgi:2-dehydropantoate 2-reductase
MRVLVVGAGAIGGYFGGRLAKAGRDVTFLVRSGRAAQLRERGLWIRSPRGDVEIQSPSLVTAEELREPFDLVLLSCKAYDLATAIQAFTPAVGPGTTILPLLNGMRHLDVLDAAFGAKAVLGGLCLISTALDANGTIQHRNETHTLTFGERHARRTARIEAISTVLDGANFDATLTESIVQDMWEKWAFIASLAGSTCLMRAPLGDILTTAVGELPASILSECAEIAKRAGFPLRAEVLPKLEHVLMQPGSTLSASMLHDIERGAHTEADQILGDLLQRREGLKAPFLELAYAHVKAYETRRAREALAGK